MEQYIMNLKRIYTAFDPELVGLLLFLLLLPFHLVLKKLLPPPLGTYWKELLLGLLLAVWVFRQGVMALRLRQYPRWSGLSPLNIAVLIYLGLLLLRFGLDRSGEVGAWGLYISVMYLPLFWLVPAALRRHPGWTVKLMMLLVGVGGVVALGGLAEFILDTPLWPSAELTQRQGFPDVFIYGTHIRRVYFTFDSPTALANTIALLFPLALSLIVLSRRLWVRLMVGLVVLGMAACIIVTFSRGIWVSTALSLAAVAGLILLVQLKRWLLPITGSAALLALLGWGLASLLRPGPVAAANEGVVELSPAAYQAAPFTGIAQELLDSVSLDGQPVLQTWSLFDPISGQYDVRPVLSQRLPASGSEEISYQITAPQAGALRFGIALAPEVWSPKKGDGTSFQIYLTPDNFAEGQTIFTRYINPKHNPSDRRWRNFLVDLSPWAGQRVTLDLITEAGPNRDWAFDWGGWSELQLVSLEPGYFGPAPAENVLVRHAGSTLDWSGDETNRDRLMAWSLALDAWQTAPLWGKGLGSTGGAALRTNPEQAFVTESQALKALVELGIPGLLTLAYLWWQIGRTGLQAYQQADRLADRALLLGLLTSLLVIFIESWIYQNLEVKQVNAYFWGLVGILSFLSEQGHAKRNSIRHYH